MAGFDLETELWREGYRLVAGVDEAGRGPLAGPVVTAAVILPSQWLGDWPSDWPETHRLDDSKRLSAGQRNALFETIRKHALAWRVRAIGPETIDRINILQATLLGMARSVAALDPAPDFVLVDGNKLPETGTPARAVVKGDRISATIAAASILAKVVRDRVMEAYHARYPQWDFARHKGYPTAAHREALLRHGPSPIHRVSFRVKGGSPGEKFPCAGPR